MECGGGTGRPARHARYRNQTGMGDDATVSETP
jgi:hypothetical protein